MYIKINTCRRYNRAMKKIYIRQTRVNKQHSRMDGRAGGERGNGRSGRLDGVWLEFGSSWGEVEVESVRECICVSVYPQVCEFEMDEFGVGE